jgi:hypothetical protein
MTEPPDNPSDFLELAKSFLDLAGTSIAVALASLEHPSTGVAAGSAPVVIGMAEAPAALVYCNSKVNVGSYESDRVP